MQSPAEGGGAADDTNADAILDAPPRGGDGGSGVDGAPPVRLPDQGPPGWLDGVRAQMQDSSSFQRRDALASIVALAMPPAGSGAKSVHKAVFRAASSLLVDPGLQVREAAQEALARLAAACPQGRAWCVKYVGLLLSTTEPVRVRLFLIQTLKLFVSDALALVHDRSGSGEPRADSAVGEDAGAQRYGWFEGARAAAIEVLKRYVEAEQTASNHKVFQHEEHGVLVEKTDAADGQPCEMFEAATGRLVWTRARFLKSFFLRVSKACEEASLAPAHDAEDSQYGAFDRLSEALTAYRALLRDARDCHYSEEALLQAQDGIFYFEHLSTKAQELARLAHAATQPLKTSNVHGKTGKTVERDERLRHGEEDREARVMNVRLLGYSSVFASLSLPPPSGGAQVHASLEWDVPAGKRAVDGAGDGVGAKGRDSELHAPDKGDEFAERSSATPGVASTVVKQGALGLGTAGGGPPDTAIDRLVGLVALGGVSHAGGGGRTRLEKRAKTREEVQGQKGCRCQCERRTGWCSVKLATVCFGSSPTPWPRWDARMYIYMYVSLCLL